jgi:hypothetical protein
VLEQPSPEILFPSSHWPPEQGENEGGNVGLTVGPRLVGTWEVGGTTIN